MQEKTSGPEAVKKSKTSQSVETKSHQRKLLSLEILEVADVLNDVSMQEYQNMNFQAAFQVGDFVNINQRTVSKDDIFLADWIANTKQKQLSFENDQSETHKRWRSRYGNWQPHKQQGATSFLPWERHKTFEQLQKSRERWKRSQEFTNYNVPSRKLMDTFADSLLHVHRIYNRKFGYMGRKVPAHMPHMIDVKVMEELQALLPEEFDQTSSHKLRSSDDMQFAFSYYYYVVGQKKTPNITEFFAEVDADHSGKDI